MRRMLLVLLVLLAPALGRLSPGVAEEPATGAFAWGLDDDGQLGDGNSGGSRAFPTTVTVDEENNSLNTVKSVSSGGFHTLALAADGTVWSWGQSKFAQLGYATKGGPRPAPQHVERAVDVDLEGIVAIDAGTTGNLALTKAGTVLYWGESKFGEAGDGTLGEMRIFPVTVKNAAGSGVLTGITAISSGNFGSAAVASDGTVWTWGWNVCGQSANDTPTQTQTLPFHAKDSTGKGVLKDIVAVSSGGAFTLALTRDGRVWAWGCNTFGELGTGRTSAEERLPVLVTGPNGTGALTGVIAISAGNAHSLALTADGHVYAWGYDASGQVGDASAGDDRTIPGEVVGPGGSGILEGITAVSAGSDHSLAIDADGRAWAWGSNQYGQLGNDGGPVQAVPAMVETLFGDGHLGGGLAVSAGGYHSAVISTLAAATLTAPASTRTRQIPISLTGRSAFGIIGYYVSENPTPPPGTSTAWAKTPPTSFTLSDGEGRKTLYGFVRDGEGVISPASTATVLFDATSPVARLTLPRFASKLSAHIRLSGRDATGVTGYFVSRSGKTPAVDAAGWRSTPPRAFRLRPGKDGRRTLFAWTKDGAGNISARASASTLLHRRAPGVTISAPSERSTVPQLTRIAGLSADAVPGSGVTRIRYAISRTHGAACDWWRPRAGNTIAGACDKPVWFPVRARRTWEQSIGRLASPGGWTLLVEARDGARNTTRVTRHFTIEAPGRSPGASVAAR